MRDLNYKTFDEPINESLVLVASTSWEGLNEPAQTHSIARALLVHTHFYINKIFECKIVNIFLPISFNICFGCSKEPSL